MYVLNMYAVLSLSQLEFWKLRQEKEREFPVLYNGRVRYGTECEMLTCVLLMEGSFRNRGLFLAIKKKKTYTQQIILQINLQL